MSALASFYVLSQSDFEHFCQLARLAPFDLEKMRGKVVQARKLVKVDTASPEFKQGQDHYESVWDYMRTKGKCPYEYDWSGYVLSELLGYLKDAKDIDLLQNTFTEPSGGFAWHVFDKSTKEKYLSQLNPANFTETELASTPDVQAEMMRNMMKEVASKVEDPKLKALAQMAMVHEEEFPEKGQATMEGIKIIHDYLQLVHDKQVVVLNIG